MFYSILSILLLMAIISGLVWMFIYFKGQVKNTQNIIVTAEEHGDINYNSLSNIQRTYIDRKVFQETSRKLNNQVDSNIKTLSNNYNATNNYLYAINNSLLNYSKQLGYIVQDVSNDVVEMSKNISSSGLTTDKLANTVSGFGNSFKTNKLNIGAFSIYELNSNLNITPDNSNNYVNFHNFNANNLYGQSMQVGNYSLDQLVNSNLQISGPGTVILPNLQLSNLTGESINISKKISFADVNSPYTFDVNSNGDMRLMMALGISPNGTNKSVQFIDSDQSPIHSFDNKGNAMHSSNVNINNGCLVFGSNAEICYSYGQGLETNHNLIISDNLQVTNSLSTNSLGIGNLNISVENNKLVVVNGSNVLGQIQLVSM